MKPSEVRHHIWRLEQFASRQPQGDHSRRLATESAAILSTLLSNLEEARDKLQAIDHVINFDFEVDKENRAAETTHLERRAQWGELIRTGGRRTAREMREARA